ncbi:MAG: hypothetical protein ABSB79_05230 [Syntrophales bacterium]|jgi:hypothetical protein
MKHFLFIIMAIAFAVSAEAADVGVSISVGQPGFYGNIDIGNGPRPELINPNPVVIVPGPVGMAPPPPLYMHVPPGHAKHWKRYCHKYNACNRPVYFVHDKWYNNVYVPQYQALHKHDDRHDDKGNRWHGKGHDEKDNHGQGRGHDEKDNRGHDRGHDRD